MNTDRFVGLPYKDMGRDYEGVDCWGLLFLFYRDEMGIDVPDYLAACVAPFSHRQRANAIRSGLQLWRRRTLNSEQFGDGVLIRNGRYFSHVGIKVPGGILHCEEGALSIIEPATSPILASRIEGYYAYTGQT